MLKNFIISGSTSTSFSALLQSWPVTQAVINQKENIMAGKKSGGFNKEGIEGLAKDKPVVYEIQDKKVILCMWV